MTVPMLVSPTLTVAHGFFTRVGGVSEGGYASLNCSLSGQDEPDRVRENRARVAAALAVAPDYLIGCRQVHGSRVMTVTQPWAYGRGPDADAMVTDRPGVALGIITADCAPVLFADRRAGVIGAAHAGWRGAASGVLEAVIAAMVGLGAEVERIATTVGPCIGQPSYEVAADMRNTVLAASPDAAALFVSGSRPEHWLFDLAGYCALRISGIGVGSAPDLLREDTMSDPTRFFSHRRRTLAGGGVIGHQISAIVI